MPRLSVTAEVRADPPVVTVSPDVPPGLCLSLPWGGPDLLYDEQAVGTLVVDSVGPVSVPSGTVNAIRALMVEVVSGSVTLQVDGQSYPVSDALLWLGGSSAVTAVTVSGEGTMSYVIAGDP